MAQVPYSPGGGGTAGDFVEPTGPSGALLSVQASPNAFGAGIGEAEQRSGAATETAGNATADLVLKQQSLINETVANDRLQQWGSALGDFEFGLYQQKGLNAVQAYNKLKTDLPKQMNDLADTIQSPMAKVAFQREAISNLERTLRVGGSYAAQQLDQANIASFQGKIATVRNLAVLHYGDPGALDDSIRQTVDATLSIAHARGVEDTDAVNAQVSHNVGEMLSDVVTTMTSQGRTPADQIKALNQAEQLFTTMKTATIPGSPGVPMLDAAHQDRLSQMFQTRSYTLQLRQDAEESRALRLEMKAAATARVGMSRDLDNAGAMVKNGFAPTNLPTDQRIRAAYPEDPEQAERVSQYVGDLRTMGGMVARLPSMAPADIAEATKEFQPDPNQPGDFARKSRLMAIWQSAVQGHVKGLVGDGTHPGDPAGRVLSSDPGTAALWTTYQTAVKGGDPQAAATAFAAYADHTVGAQTDLGLTPDQTSVLPAQVADSYVQKITGNPETAPATLKALSTQYGEQWPQVWRDLVTRGGLPAQYQAVGTLDNEADGAQLAQWLAAGKAKDAKRNIADLVGGDKPLASINAAIDSSPDLRQLARSLHASGASQNLVGDVIQSVKDLAYAKASAGDPDPANKALAAFTGKYAYLGMARVPHAVLDAVSQNAQVTLQGLSDSKIDIPDLYGKPGQPKPQEYIDLLRAAPAWITAPKADALWLMDNGGRLVRDKRGVPVAVPFSQAAPTEPASAVPPLAIPPFGT